MQIVCFSAGVAINLDAPENEDFLGKNNVSVATTLSVTPTLDNGFRGAKELIGKMGAS